MRLLACLVFAVLPACSDPSAPSRSPTRLLAGRDYDGTVAPGDTLRFEYDAPAAASFVVVISALTKDIWISERDSTGREVTTRLRASAAFPEASTLILPQFFTDKARRFRFAVWGEGAYRLRVHDAAPERAPVVVPLSQIIDESIEAVGDIDIFRIEATPGDVLIAYVQALDGSPGSRSGTLHLHVDGQGLLGSLEASSRSGDPELETQATAPWVATADARYTANVRGSYRGRYRLMVRRIDHRPESAPATLADNTIVLTERFDYVGDRDEFTLRAPPGSIYNLLFRLTSGDRAASAQLLVSGIGDADLAAEKRVTGRDSVLFDLGTGRVTMDADGTATITTIAESLTRGSYELLAARIDTQPEQVSRRLAVEDSIMGERIDIPGDVDDFELNLPLPTAVSFFLTREVASVEWARAGYYLLSTRVYDAADSIRVRVDADSASVGSGRATLDAGRYRVRVLSIGEGYQAYRGSYSLSVRELNTHPDGVPSALRVGSVVDERIEPAGDVDIYTVDAALDEDFRLTLLSPEGPRTGNLSALVIRESDGRAVGDAYSGATDVSSGRIAVRAAGKYRIEVRSQNGGRLPSERGPYRLMLQRLTNEPERHAPVVAVGTSITSELLDALGDVDDFTLVGTPGSLYTVLFTASAATRGAHLAIIDPTTRAEIANTQSYAGAQSVGRLVMPPAGRVILRVYEYPFEGIRYNLVGSYTIATHSIDLAPERASATIAVGDTVRVEAIDPPGDIDEFSLAGRAGRRVTIILDIPFGTSFPGVIAELFAPGRSVPLTAIQGAIPSSAFGSDRSPVVTLPVDGTYVLRVRNLEERSSERISYRFAIVEQ